MDRKANRKREAAHQQPRRRDPPLPPPADAGRTRRQNRPGPPGPAEPEQAREVPSPCATYAPLTSPPPTPAAPSSAQNNTAGQGAGPPGPRWGPKGPDLGQASSAPSRCAVPRPRGHATASSLPAVAPPGRRRCRRKPTGLGAPPPAEETPRLPYTRAGKEAPPPPAPRGLCPAACADGGGGEGRRGARALGLVALPSPAGSDAEGRNVDSKAYVI
nr:uncharacterized protein LOC127310632 [Lolium perenne]